MPDKRCVIFIDGSNFYFKLKDLKLHNLLNFDFGKFTFRKIYWPKDKDEKGTLFIGSVYSLPEKDLERDGVKIIQEITDPQGYVIYRIAGT